MSRSESTPDSTRRIAFASRGWTVAVLCLVSLGTIAVLTWSTTGSEDSAKSTAAGEARSQPVVRSIEVTAAENPHARLAALGWPEEQDRPLASPLAAARSPQGTRPLAEPPLRPVAPDPQVLPPIEVDPKKRKIPHSPRRTLE